MIIDKSMLKNKVLDFTLYYEIWYYTVNFRNINNSEFLIPNFIISFKHYCICGESLV